MNIQSKEKPNTPAVIISGWVRRGLRIDGVWFVCVFTLVSMLLCYPLWREPTAHLHALPLGDKGTNLWNLWWVYYALFERQVSPLWCELIFYPWGGDLRYHTLSMVNGIIAAPVTAGFGSVAAYNGLFFFWTVLTGVFGALWGRRFGLSRQAAFAIGFIAAFHPFRWNHIEHLNLFSTAWLLASFYGCERWLQRRSIFVYVGFLLSWTLALFSNWYFGLFVGIYFGLRIAVEWSWKWEGIRLGRVAVVCVIPAVWFGFLLQQYFQAPHVNLPYAVEPDEVSMIYSSYWSLTAFHFITPIWLLHVLPPPNNVGAEFRLHPGLLQMGMMIPAFMGYRRLQMERYLKRFLVVLSLVFAVISLGPFLQVWGMPVSVNGIMLPFPGILFELVPGLTSMRVYARFGYIAWLGLGVVGWLWLDREHLNRWNPSGRWMLIGGILLVFMLETGWKPLEMHRYDADQTDWFEARTGPVLEIPFEPTRFSGAHLYHQTLHHQPIYVVEFSRIPSYRKAYLDAHPFLRRINAYIEGTQFTREEEERFLDQLCNGAKGLGVGSIRIGDVPPSAVLFDRPNKIQNRFQVCFSTP